jgi:hypothetical protein
LSFHCPLYLQSIVLCSYNTFYCSSIVPLFWYCSTIPFSYCPIVLTLHCPYSIYTVASSPQLLSWKSSDSPCLILCELML